MNIQYSQLIKNKGLFWLTMLEVSIHDRWACCSEYVTEKTAHSVRSFWQSKLLTPGPGAKEKENRDQQCISPLRMHYQLALPPGVHLLYFHHFPILPGLGSQAVCIWIFGGHLFELQPDFSCIYFILFM